MIRVLVADDQPLIRTGLRTILEAEPDLSIVGEAADGLAAAQLTADLRPDVVLMDIGMPGVDGIEATRLIRAAPECADIRVIILTTFDLDENVYQALRAGADGFLVKDVADDQLVAGIRTAALGEALLAPSVTRRLIETYTRSAPPGQSTPGADTLSAREREVWQLLGRGYSNAEIANELFIGEATAKTHVAHVLMKLDARDRVAAVVLAHQAGIA